jgi:hypothetical protein
MRLAQRCCANVHPVFVALVPLLALQHIPAVVPRRLLLPHRQRFALPPSPHPLHRPRCCVGLASALPTIAAAAHRRCRPSPLPPIAAADHLHCPPSPLPPLAAAAPRRCRPSPLPTISTAHHLHCPPSPLPTMAAADPRRCRPSPLPPLAAAAPRRCRPSPLPPLAARFASCTPPPPPLPQGAGHVPGDFNHRGAAVVRHTGHRRQRVQLHQLHRVQPCVRGAGRGVLTVHHSANSPPPPAGAFDVGDWVAVDMPDLPNSGGGGGGCAHATCEGEQAPRHLAAVVHACAQSTCAWLAWRCS